MTDLFKVRPYRHAVTIAGREAQTRTLDGLGYIGQIRLDRGGLDLIGMDCVMLY